MVRGSRLYWSLYRSLVIAVTFALVVGSIPASASPAPRAESAIGGAAPAVDVAESQTAVETEDQVEHNAAESDDWRSERTPLASAPEITVESTQPVAIARPAAAPMAAVAAATIPLGTGWQLISHPEEPIDTSPAAVLASIAGSYDLVSAYDACDSADPWKDYDPNAPAASDLAVIDHTMGIWVRMTAPVVFSSAGTPRTSTDIPLCTGWNLIGYPLDVAQPVNSALASIAGKYTRVFGYDAYDLSDPWAVFSLGVPTWANELDQMEPGKGYWVYATENTTLTISRPAAPPAIAFDAPEGMTVTKPISITGAIAAGSVTNWTLEYRMQDDDTWIELASGNTGAGNTFAGSFDPTLLLNGLFEIRATATDSANQTTTESLNVVVEGDMKIGNFAISFVDLTVELSGIPIQVIRTYDSRDKRKGDFGFGWSLSVKDVRMQANRAIGANWIGTRSGDFVPTYCIEPAKAHIIVVTLVDGTVYRFRPKLTPRCQTLFPITTVAVSYESLPGTNASLRPLVDANARVVGSYPGELELQDLTGESVLDPAQYELTPLSGTKLEVLRRGGVRSITDLNGNMVIFSAAGITHSAGESIAFVRDVQGRISQITGVGGNQLNYVYDANGDLESVANPESRVTRFTYNAVHDLLSIVNADGKVITANEYDTDSRLIGTADGRGNSISIEHQLSNNTETVRDRLGNQTVYVYNDRGDIVSQTDALGHTKTFVYDERGNMLSRTDPLGNFERFTYNTYGQPTSYTNALGNTWHKEYDGFGRLLLDVDPLGRTSSYKYDGKGNVSRFTAPNGGSSAYGYNSRGDLISIEDPTGASATILYDSQGRSTGYVDPMGRTAVIEQTQDGQVKRDEFTVGGQIIRYDYSYNLNGELTDITLPNGQTGTVSYNPVGLISSVTNIAHETQSMSYDTAGNIISFRDFDGSTSEMSYDAENRIVQSVDSSGRATRITYDALDRPVTTTLPSGVSISSVFDPAGRITRLAYGGRGSRTYVYDAAGRVTSELTSSGGLYQYGYDAANQLRVITNSVAVATELVYDNSGRVVETRFADQNSVKMTYDLMGHPTSLVDERGAEVAYAYDAIGQMTAITDALGAVTQYLYDEVGHILSATTPSGNTWTFTYNSLGVPTSRTYPWGGIEQYAFDASGQITQVVDGAGLLTTMSYDPVGRLLTRTLESGPVESRMYDASKRLQSTRDASGETTYSYDPMGRVTRISYSDGNYVEYDYDQFSRLTRLSTAAGSTSYAYAEDGKLLSVSDSEVGTALYTYDVADRPVEIDLPDGSTTVLEYNVRGWLTRIRSVAANSTVLRDQALTYDPSGNLLSNEDSVTGRRQEYSYDAGGRVTGEVRQSSTSNLNVVYQYDDDWDLLQKGTQFLNYDGNMRLVSDGVWSNYSYDAAGRPIARSKPGLYEQFTYDSMSRLVRVQRTGSLPSEVNLTYNSADLLVRIEADGIARNLIWDLTGQIPQLLEERSSSGALIRRYIQGLGPIAVQGATDTVVLHREMLGSVGIITSARSGTVVSHYEYGAYGDEASNTTDESSLIRYAGEYYVPEVGMYFLRARFYDPVAGRFWTPDQIDTDPLIPQSYNPYLYVGANPVRFTDPLGTESLSSVSVSIAVAGILSGMALDILPAPNGLIAGLFGYLRRLFTLTPKGFSAAITPNITRSPGSVLGFSAEFEFITLWEPDAAEHGLGLIVWFMPTVGAQEFGWDFAVNLGAIPKTLEPGLSAEVQFSGTYANALVRSVDDSEGVAFFVDWKHYQGSIQYAPYHPDGLSIGVDQSARVGLSDELEMDELAPLLKFSHGKPWKVKVNGIMLVTKFPALWASYNFITKRFTWDWFGAYISDPGNSLLPKL